MKRSINNLMDFKLHTSDQTSGNVKDILFDEKRWIIRYIEVDFGNFFNSQRVLIPKSFWENPDWENEEMPLPITKDEIGKCPRLENHKPVSREYETQLHKYYRLNPYWPTANLGMAGGFYPPRPINIPDAENETEINSVLRSFREVHGYEIKAMDGRIGHIHDLLVDDDDWQLVYAIVDTSNWLPWSKKVIIPLSNMTKIDYLNRDVAIDLNIESIRNAPEYDPSTFLTQEHEEDIFDFYNASLTK